MDRVKNGSLFPNSEHQVMLKKDRLYRGNITFYWFTITVFFKNAFYIKILAIFISFLCLSAICF